MTQEAEVKLQSTEKLLARIKELEEVNYMMAHDLRGAAGNIKMLSEILLNRKKEISQPTDNQPSLVDNEILTDDEILECIHLSSDALMNTLCNMMTSVNQQLKERAAPEDCDVEKIVRNVTCQLNGFLIQKRAKIIMNLAIKKVKCASRYLENLLYNLISNSIKYSRPGTPVRIEISTRKVNGRTVLYVADNGLGIDMDKYGDKLFKLHNTFHEGCDSTGVGLYITKSQIESLGGSISVKSEVNKGTEFIVEL